MALKTGPEENKATRFGLKFKQTCTHGAVRKPMPSRQVIINVM